MLFFFFDNPFPYQELFFNLIGIPIKNDRSTLGSKKNLEFFCYKIITTKEKNLFLLILINETACFKLNNIYGCNSEFILITDYKIETLFKDDMNETFEKKNIIYLPLKVEKITIKQIK